MRNLSGRLFFWVSIIATVVSMNFWALSMLVTEVTPLFIALTVINAVCLIVTLICMSIDIYKTKKRKEQTASADESVEERAEAVETEESVESAEPEVAEEPAVAVEPEEVPEVAEVAEAVAETDAE